MTAGTEWIMKVFWEISNWLASEKQSSLLVKRYNIILHFVFLHFFILFCFQIKKLQLKQARR